MLGLLVLSLIPLRGDGDSTSATECQRRKNMRRLSDRNIQLVSGPLLRSSCIARHVWRTVPEVKPLLLLLGRRGVRRRRKRCVCARDGDRRVLLLARRRIDVLVVAFLEAWGNRREGWRHCLCAGRGIEAVLVHLRCCVGDLDGGCLQAEGLWLDDLADLGILDLAVVLVGSRHAVGINVVWVSGWWAPAARAGRKRAKAGRVGGGLRTQLGKVEVRTGSVALSHGLPQLLLRPEAVEDDAVDDDAKDFDDDFDDGADKAPVLDTVRWCSTFEILETYLKTADECVRDIFLKQVPALVVYARPTPHVFVVILCFTLVEDCCSHSPHDDAENEESDSEDGVVGGDLFGSMMTTSTISDHDNDRHDEGDASNDKE
jgi:hypothetical protein